MKNYKYLHLITVAYVVVLLVANIASTKIARIWLFTLDGGTIIFPLSYIFNDVLTEVYGYRASRQTIWLGFSSALFMSLILLIVGFLPPAEGWDNQAAYMTILGQAPRIIFASLVAYIVGEFANSYILAKLKIKTGGKLLWLRTIGSTLAGELLDSLIFVTIAFFATLPNDTLIDLIIFNYIFKTSVEIIFTPITYLIINRLKKSENENYFDTKTNFNPFLFR